MKINLSTCCLLPFFACLPMVAAPVTVTTVVHSRPDELAPAITFLKAGTTPIFAPAPAPSGWVAVELPGPFEGYVQNKDIGKSLDVRLGAAIHLHPQNNSAIITLMEAEDRSTITGLHGKWTQIRLDKKITGFIRVATNLAPAAAAPTLSDVVKPPAAAAPAPAPITPAAYGVGTAGRPAPMVNLGDSGPGALPRLFQGKFASSKRPFAPRRPYDWQLNDDAGVRYAYLDLSKLLLTDQIENYANHVVVVYGKPKPMSGSRDIVIEVESLQLR